MKKYKQAYDSDGEDIGLESYYEQIKPKDRYKEGNKNLEYAKMKKKKLSQSMIEQQEEQERL